MTENIRVKKTNDKIKASFLDLIVREDFEKLSVKSICEASNISRITFYDHYKDKYELLDDIFNDMYQEALVSLPLREKINNPENDPYKHVSNYLYYFVEALNKRINLVVSISKHLAGYIYFAFENFFKAKFKDMLVNSGIHKKLKYSIEQTISFITGGIMSFIVSGVQTSKYENFEQIFYDSQSLFISLLKSDIIYE